MQEKPKSYCESRLEKYGITDEWNRVKITVADDVYQSKPELLSWPIFAPDEHDNIRITYLELTGYFVQYTPNGKRWKKHFTRERLNPKNQKGDHKYNQEYKSGVHIHLNPRIIDKYKKAEHIETLVMVEGEFKGWLGYMHGLDIVGVPSISAYKEKGKDELHETLREIIRVCTVENLVMVYDADFRAVKWEKWDADPDYDIGKKLNNFYQSAKNIRDYARKLVKDVYACHINEDLLQEQIGGDTVKGLDDLYLFCKGKEREVTEELLKLRSSKKYFTYLNLTAESPGQIRDFYNVSRDRSGKPTDFYLTHRSKLQEREFVFMGFKYKWNNVNEELEILRHPDSEKFVRVACDYIKIITIPENIRGVKVLRRKLEPWKSGELTRDYVQKGYKNFFETIRKYDQFTVYPDNTESYKQVIDNCYNMYYQVTHTPAEGQWPTIEMFLKHLFGDQIEMCYDYLQLLYLTPTQTLPIIALVSEDRGTGKTKFLELLREIFCENVTILGNDAITDNYNDDYASKLVIGIDEGLIEKKATVEKIKSWSTATRIKMNTKFMSRQEIPFYGKIIITSNNTDSFIQIEDKETRFWVRNIPKIEKEDPRLMQKMEKEIPHFLHFLKNRKLVHECKTRQWFDNDLLETDALKEIKANSYGWLHKELREFMQENFFNYGYHELCYSLKEIMALLNGKEAGARFRQAEVKKEIVQKFKIKQKFMRAQFPEEGNTNRLRDKPPGRYYTFNIEQFLSDDEIRQIGYDPEVLRKIRLSDCSVELWPGSKYSPPGVQGQIFAGDANVDF